MTHRLLSAAAVVAGLALSSSAWGHALSVDKNAPAGGCHLVQIGIPYGCAGSPTNTVRIRIPDEIFMVRPELKAGWEMSMNMRKMEPPITSEGVTYTESVHEIIWSGGNIGDLEFDRFNLLAPMPREEGKFLYFRTIQACVEGENRWVDIPEEGRTWGSYKYPAPFVRIGPPQPRPEPSQEALAR